VKASSKTFSKADLAALFAGARSLRVSRGAKSVLVDLKAAPPGSAAFAEAVCGSTGNLRAPAARAGKDWLIGFNEGGWEASL
jgi:hypothetical protein